MSKIRRDRRTAARAAAILSTAPLLRPAPPRQRAPSNRGGAAKMAAGAAAAALGREGGEDAFRRLFRFYRQRDAADLRGVVDFSAPGGQVTARCRCPRCTGLGVAG